MARKTNERLVATPKGDVLQFAVVDAEGNLLRDDLTLHAYLHKIPASLQGQLAMHGLKQKIADAAAIPRDESGRSATWETKIAAMRQVYGNLMMGEWSARGTGDGSSSPAGLLFTALQRLYPALSVEQIKAKLDSMDKSTQAKMRKAPKVAAMIETIKAERAKDAPEVDDDEVDSLFDDLEGEGDE